MGRYRRRQDGATGGRRWRRRKEGGMFEGWKGKDPPSEHNTRFIKSQAPPSPNPSTTPCSFIRLGWQGLNRKNDGYADRVAREHDGIKIAQFLFSTTFVVHAWLICWNLIPKTCSNLLALFMGKIKHTLLYTLPLSGLVHKTRREAEGGREKRVKGGEKRGNLVEGITVEQRLACRA